MPPKAVQAEESVERHFEGLLKGRVPAQVGLLIGKPGVGSRDLVLAAVPTPSADNRQVLTLSSSGSAPAASKTGRKPTASAKGGSSGEPGVAIELDADGIAEHALQVAMMLPGGLAVLGLFLFAPESGYARCTSQLTATLSAIAADAAAAAAAAASSSGSGSTTKPQQQLELLLLHVDSASRKFSMRGCLASAGAAAAAGSLKPVPDFKFGPSLASLVPLRTCHAFDVTLPAGAAGATLQSLLAEAAAAEGGRVMASLALLSGAAPAVPSQQLGDLLAAASAGTSGMAPAWVNLYCSPSSTSTSSSSSGSKGSSGQAVSTSSGYVGSVRLQGCIQALAYAHRRDSAAKALTELKQDVAASLAARLAAVADDALAAAADAADAAAAGAAAPAGGSSSPPAHPLLAEAGSAGRSLCGLPRRVLLPWADLGLQVCAYLADDEGPAAAVERAQQLLPLPSLTAAEVQEVEAPAVVSTAAAGGSAVKGNAVGGGGAAAAGCGGAVAAAAAAGAVAAVSVALAYLNLGQQ